MITIHTQLLNNDPFRSRILTMDDSECKMFIIYRGDEHLISNYPELGQHAFYILFGHEPINRRRQAYIGQTQNAITRFEQHIATKDFWECMCIFINTHEQFIRSDIQYLEYLGIKTAIECASFDLLENCQIPREPLLKRDQVDRIMLYFSHIELLLNYSGFYLFYRKQFNLESFSKKNSHKIIDRMVKQYNEIKDTNKYTDYNNYDSDYDEEEESIMEHWKGNTWKVDVLPCKNGKYLLFTGGYIAPVNDNNIRNDILENLFNGGFVRRDNMYISKFIDCNSLEDAKLIVEGK